MIFLINKLLNTQSYDLILKTPWQREVVVVTIGIHTSPLLPLALPYTDYISIDSNGL